MDVRLLQAESLADRQLDHLGARGRRLDRLEQREVVERIGLAADGEAADPAITGIGSATDRAAPAAAPRR